MPINGNVPMQYPFPYKTDDGNDQTSGGGGGSGVSSFTGDGQVLNNSASTGAVTASLATHNKNLVLASNATTDGETPTFRALVAADLPGGTGTGSVTSVSATTVVAGTSVSVSNPTTTPTIAITNASVIQNMNMNGTPQSYISPYTVYNFQASTNTSTTFTLPATNSTNFALGQIFEIYNYADTATLQVNASDGSSIYALKGTTMIKLRVLTFGVPGTWLYSTSNIYMDPGNGVADEILQTDGTGQSAWTPTFVQTLNGDGIIYSNGVPQIGEVSLGSMLKTQNPNKVLAGPTDPGDAEPDFRFLTEKDITFTLHVGSGGTGLVNLPSYAIPYGNPSDVTSMEFTPDGSGIGQVLSWNGPGAGPSWINTVNSQEGDGILLTNTELDGEGNYRLVAVDVVEPNLFYGSGAGGVPNFYPITSEDLPEEPELTDPTLDGTTTFPADAKIVVGPTTVYDGTAPTPEVNLTCPVNVDVLNITGVATFTAAVDVNANMDIGVNSSNNVTINSTSDFKAPVTMESSTNMEGNTTLGTNSSNSMTVNATTDMKGPTTFDASSLFNDGASFAFNQNSEADVFAYNTNSGTSATMMLDIASNSKHLQVGTVNAGAKTSPSGVATTKGAGVIRTISDVDGLDILCEGSAKRIRLGFDTGSSVSYPMLIDEATSNTNIISLAAGYTSLTMTGNVTLTSSSTTVQYISSWTSGAIILPDSTTCLQGLIFIVVNSTSSSVLLENHSATTLITIPAGQSVIVVNTSTGSANSFVPISISSGGGGGAVSSVAGDGVIFSSTPQSGAVVLTPVSSNPNSVLFGGSSSPSYSYLFKQDSWNNSSGDLTLTNLKNTVQYITGSTAAINCFLPDSSTCQPGQTFIVINDSSNNVIIYDHVGSSNHITLFPSRVLTANNFSSTVNGFWYWSILPSNNSGNFPVLDANYGGTGQITYSPGDILYSSNTFPSTTAQSLSKLPIGASGQFLSSNGTSPTWATLQNTFASVNMNGTPTNLVLTNTSATVQNIIAYTSGNILMPDTTTCVVGQTFYLINATSSSYIPLKNSSGGNLFSPTATVPASTNVGLVCFSTSSANNWDKIGITSVGGGSTVLGYIGAGGLGINQWPAINELIVSGAASSGTAPCDFVSNIIPSGIPLVSAGTGNKPSFTTAVVGGGGTGQTSFTSGGVLYGQGTSGLGVTSAGSNGQVLTTNGITPSFNNLSFTNISGQATLAQMPTGSANQILAGNNSWINSFPMDSWNNSSGDRTLLFSNNTVQYINGSTAAINCFLPDSSTCQQGQIFIVLNDSSNNVTVYDHVGSSNHITLFPSRILVANNFSSASNGFWYWSILPSNNSGNLPVIDANYGGTGQITYAVGDMLYANSIFPSTSAQSLSRLTIGASGQMLSSNGTSPVWQYPYVNGHSAFSTWTGDVNASTTTEFQILSGTYTSGALVFPKSSATPLGQKLTVINLSASAIPLHGFGGSNFGSIPPQICASFYNYLASSNDQWSLYSQSSVLSSNLGVFNYYNNVNAGGLGFSLWPAVNSVLLSGSSATSSTSPAQVVTNNSASGIPLISQGTSTKPVFGTALVPGGGTGQTSFTAGCVLFGNGTSGLSITTLGTNGQVLTSSGSSSGPTWTNVSAGGVTSVTGDGVLTTTSTVSGAVTITIPTVTGANKFWANTTSGSTPNFRVIAGSDLPLPSATTLGGIESIAASSSKWINSISTSGVPNLTQPAFTDISGSASLGQLPTGSANQFLAGNNAWKNAFPMDSYNNSSGDYTLVNTNNVVQYINGSTGSINLFLPGSSTCQQGQIFVIINDSSNNVVVYDHTGSSNHITLFPSRILLANNFSSATNGFWYWSILPSNNSGNFPVLDANYGGTGNITYAVGDILYSANTFPSTSAQALSRLPIGSAYQVLQVSSGSAAPTWGALSSGSLFSGQIYTTASSTLTLTTASPTYTNLNAGSVTVKMPNATLVPVGTVYVIDCFDSSGTNVVQTSSGATIYSFPSEQWRITLNCAGGAAGNWAYTLEPFGVGASAPNAFYTVPQGGTGANSFTSNGVLYGNGTGLLQSTAQGAASTYLTANAGAPVFTSYASVNSSTSILGATTNPVLTVNTSNCDSSIMGNIVYFNARNTWGGVTSTGTGGLIFQLNGLNPLTSKNDTTVLNVHVAGTGAVEYTYYARLAANVSGKAQLYIYNSSNLAQTDCATFFTTYTSGSLEVSGTLQLA